MSAERRETTAAALRRAFDRSFAQPHGAAHDAHENLLAIRVGGDPYALRLSDIAGLHADRAVVPVPSRAPELLGLVALRGALAPVFDLRALLGYAAGAPPLWLVLVRTPDPVGLAFDAFESHLRLTAAEITASAPDGAAAPHVRGVVRTADGMRPLLDTVSLIEAITRRARLDALSKEH